MESENTVRDDEVKRALSFSNEGQLRDFVAHNLQVYWPHFNLVGVEYFTEVGRIDILARDPIDGHWLIIEFKLSRGEDSVVGQIQRYMGWVKEKLAGKDERVSGVIFVNEVSEKLYYAVLACIEVTLYKYEAPILEAKPIICTSGYCEDQKGKISEGVG